MVCVDVAIFNVAFYFVMRSVLLAPLALANWMQVVASCGGFIVAATCLHRVQVWSPRASWWKFAAVMAALLGFVAAIAALASITTATKGNDWSWLRVEIVKAPYWFGMFARHAPGFAAATAGTTAWLAWMLLSSRGRWLAVLVPFVGTVACTVLVFHAFHAFPDGGDLFPLYAIMFCGPLYLLTVFMALRAYTTAFRLVPAVFHNLAIGLHYVGVIPVLSLANPLPAVLPNPTASSGVPGLKIIASPGIPANPAFMFLRSLVAAGDHLYASYGPTCGIMGINLQDGRQDGVTFSGLLRDLQLAPDGQSLWGMNWKTGDFMRFDRQPLRATCQVSVFEQGIATPWAFVVTGDTMYVTTLTRPMLAEVTVDPTPPCALRVQRKLDFHDIGYTPFTDGAAALAVDTERGRALVTVGPLEGRDTTALVEVDLASFTVARDVHIPHGGPDFVPLLDRRHVIVPSYWGEVMYEVSLDTLQIVREIPADPTIRFVEQDTRRGLLYAVSRTTGVLSVIDDATGRTLRRVPIGNKAEPMIFDRDRDMLFVGSGQGIAAIDLPRFLAGIAP